MRDIHRKKIYEYIKEEIHDTMEGKEKINNAKYHHNSTYDRGVSICKNGILTLKDLQKEKIINLTNEIYELLNDDTSHINGTDSVSLAVMGLNDLNKKEEEYDSFDPYKLDFLVSDNIKAMRCSRNYGNEYIVNESISIESLKALDIRILKLIEIVETKEDFPIEKVIEMYNHLLEIAECLKELKSNILIREMSEENEIKLDINKLIKKRKIRKELEND